MLALHAPQLLEEGEGEDLRVREPLEALVASHALGVEEAVGTTSPGTVHSRYLGTMIYPSSSGRAASLAPP